MEVAGIYENREKGVEKQFRYNCELCDACVGYRSVPFDQETKFIYVFPEAVTDSKQAPAGGRLKGPSPAEEVARAVVPGPAEEQAPDKEKGAASAAGGEPEASDEGAAAKQRGNEDLAGTSRNK